MLRVLVRLRLLLPERTKSGQRWGRSPVTEPSQLFASGGLIAEIAILRSPSTRTFAARPAAHPSEAFVGWFLSEPRPQRTDRQAHCSVLYKRGWPAAPDPFAADNAPWVQTFAVSQDPDKTLKFNHLSGLVFKRKAGQ